MTPIQHLITNVLLIFLTMAAFFISVALGEIRDELKRLNGRLSGIMDNLEKMNQKQ